MRRIAWLLALAIGWGEAGGVRADFELPILHPVEKTVVVAEEIDRDELARLGRIDNATIEVRMGGGNMMRDVLLEQLNRDFAGATKRVALQGEVKAVHVEQLGRLQRLEVAYRPGASGLDDETFNALYRLGPIRKLIHLPADPEPDLLQRVGKLKFFVPVIHLGDAPPSEALLGWLRSRPECSVWFVLPAAFPPQRVYDLCEFKPLHLLLQTRRNRLDEDLLKVIRDLRSVEVTVVVDGRLTVADVKQLIALERFSLRVDLGQPPRYTPGLSRLLNRIEPP
jgi:hypothetical protein